jgi:hypothetical protein
MLETDVGAVYSPLDEIVPTDGVRTQLTPVLVVF